MFARDVHVVLAWLVGASMVFAAVEAALRAVRGRTPGRITDVASATVLVVVGMSAAAGLAMLVAGKRPHEMLHLIYAVLAFALVPVADGLAAKASPRVQAWVRLAGVVVAIGVLARLFATG